MKKCSTLTAVCLVVHIASLGCAAANHSVAADQRPHPDSQGSADFHRRVKEYVALREQVNAGASNQQQTKDPGKIEDAQNVLGTRIRSARGAAKQGDIFAPHIEKMFRTLLRGEVKGAEGAEAKAAILDEQSSLALKVNADYPSGEPLSTVPPNVLQALPALPKDQGLEYRFVRSHLILLDTRANLVVDFLLNVIPAA